MELISHFKFDSTGTHPDQVRVRVNKTRPYYPPARAKPPRFKIANNRRDGINFLRFQNNQPVLAFRRVNVSCVILHTSNKFFGLYNINHTLNYS